MTQVMSPQGVVYRDEDILPHINAKDSLARQAASPKGCITVFSAFVCSIDVCYVINNNSADVTAELKTPFGDIKLGEAKLDLQHPSITFGGGVDGYKAEVTITLSFNPIKITACGKICAGWPIDKCAQGCIGINLAEQVPAA